MDYTKKLVYQSNYWYNDGLQKAKIRDLSGAVTSLKRSLQFNRENIMARNLLGLVYYGRGEVAEALVEWIISKNFKSYENIANYYIQRVQQTPSELEAVNQAVHKYNQCLAYCQQNGEDLAIIQLKKVVAAHPAFLKAHQLLALLYLHTGQYAKARQLLRTAHKMDTTNAITLSYMHELAQMRSQKMEKLKTQEEKKGHAMTYKLGNETIIQPVSASLKDNAAILTVLNIVIGIVLGAAVVWFLIVPAVNRSTMRESNESVLEIGEQKAAMESQIGELQKELEAYRSSSDEAKNAIATAQTTQANYEALMSVYEQYLGEDTSNADMTDGLLYIDRDNLGEKGQAVYDQISGDLFPKVCERLYGEAQAFMAAQNYAEAVAALEKVVRMDEGYSDGAALKLLGDAYAGSGDGEHAREIYEKVTSGYSGTDAANDAADAMNGEKNGNADADAAGNADAEEETSE